MNENYNHPLPKKGDLIRITEVHNTNGKPTFKIGDLVEVLKAWVGENGNTYFIAKAPFRKHKIVYSSKVYDWEIFGKELETLQQAQENTAKFVKEASEKSFEEVWENFRKNKVFPEQLFELPRAKWMFAMFFYSDFENGWNACVLNNMNEHMREVELCLNELGKLNDVHVKEPAK